jgi:transcriptional regulator with PAS, ATPase and Fis domain
VEAVVSTERDITETLHLREVLKEKEFDRKKYENEIEYLKSQNIKMWGNLIAEDDVSKVIAEKALRISKMDTTVLLLGESGTGKEVYANFIYKNSKRVGKPFIKINCAAIPENLMESELFGYEAGSFTGADRAGKIGLFEMANTGTIFLDEIGDLPIQMQSKLLRVLQEKEIMRVGGTQTIALDIRLIVATNRNLEEEIEKGKFREDLYYRLNIIPIELPPLRGRIKDIKALTKYFVSNFSVEYKINKTIDDDAIQLLQTHDWAGNIRELENIIERLMISFDGEKITRFQVEKTIGKQEKFPKEEIYQDKSYKEILAMMEEEFLTNLLKKYGRASKISEVYQIDKATLSRKMRRYGLNQK